MHLFFVFILLFSGATPYSQADSRSRQNLNDTHWDPVFNDPFSLLPDVGAMAEAQRKDAAFQERDFEQKFNRLIHSLVDFGTNYNNGHIVDVKKIKAVREAWKELEKTDWFKSRNK